MGITTTAATTTTTAPIITKEAEVFIPLNIPTTFQFSNQANDGTDAEALLAILEELKSADWPNESTLNSIEIHEFTEADADGLANANVDFTFTAKENTNDQ